MLLILPKLLTHASEQPELKSFLVALLVLAAHFVIVVLIILVALVILVILVVFCVLLVLVATFVVANGRCDQLK